MEGRTHLDSDSRLPSGLRIARLLLLGLLIPQALVAGPGKGLVDDEAPIASFPDCSWFDRAVLYRSDEGWVRRIKLQGRYHGQWEHLDANGTGRYTDFQRWEHRRFRMGLRADFAGDWSLGFHFNHSNGLNLASGDFITDLEDLILEWKPDASSLSSRTAQGISPHFLRIGKFKNNITIEETISSNSIKTLERSAFVNSTNASRPWGFELGVVSRDVRHYFGLSANAFDRDPLENEPFNWGRFDHGAIVTYRLETEITPETELHFDYMYTDTSSYGDILAAGDLIAGGAAEHLLALGFMTRKDRLEVMTEVMYGMNFSPLFGGQGVFNPDGTRDAFAFTLLPTYALTDKLELVARYHFAEYCNDENPQDNTRPWVANGAVVSRGNNSDFLTDAHFFYLGLNYYFCGDKLKILTGVEWAAGDSVDLGNANAGAADYESTTFSVAFRTTW